MLDGSILPRFGDLKLVQIRREAIETWFTERRSQVSGGTANKELARLKHVLGRAIAWNYLKVHPAQAVNRATENPSRVRYLSVEERDLLLHGREVTVTASDGREWTGRRVANPALMLYIVAALQTGARRSELIRLRWCDVDMRKRSIRFHFTKNRAARNVPMTATLYEALSALPCPLSPEAPVLPAREPKVLSRSFARLVRDLGIRNLRFHDLRHDVASRLTMVGVSQRGVMEILGHKDPRMTMIYSHLSPEYLRDAMHALETPKPQRPAREESHG